MEDPSLSLSFSTSSLMEFYSSHQPTKKNMKKDPSLEFEDDVEDDVFYAEIRRRILLLTADDDEDILETRYKNSSYVIKQPSNSSKSSFATTLQGGNHFAWWENEPSYSAPAWLSKLWRTGDGTGVFIPRIVKTRRTHRPGRMNNEGGRRYKKVENK